MMASMYSLNSMIATVRVSKVYSCVAQVWRGCFTHASFLSLLFSIFISSYIKIFMLPARELEPGSFFRLKELKGVPGFIDAHPIIVLLLIYMFLMALDFFRVPHKLFAVMKRAKFYRAISCWLAYDHIRLQLVVVFMVGMSLFLLPHVVIVILGMFMVFFSSIEIGKRIARADGAAEKPGNM